MSEWFDCHSRALRSNSWVSEGWKRASLSNTTYVAERHECRLEEAASHARFAASWSDGVAETQVPPSTSADVNTHDTGSELLSYVSAMHVDSLTFAFWHINMASVSLSGACKSSYLCSSAKRELSFRTIRIYAFERCHSSDFLMIRISDVSDILVWFE